MRRVIASELVSLDGVMEERRWTFQFSSEDRVEFTFEELSATDPSCWGG